MIESDEAQEARQIRVFSLHGMKSLKGFGTVKKVGKHASVTVIDQEESIHGVRLSLGLGF